MAQFDPNHGIPHFALLWDESCVFHRSIGAVCLAAVLKIHRLVLTHGKTGLLALYFAGIHSRAIFRTGNEDGALVCKALPGGGDGIKHCEHQDHGDHKKQYSLLVAPQAFDPFQKLPPSFCQPLGPFFPFRLAVALDSSVDPACVQRF